MIFMHNLLFIHLAAAQTECFSSYLAFAVIIIYSGLFNPHLAEPSAVTACDRGSYCGFLPWKNDFWCISVNIFYLSLIYGLYWIILVPLFFQTLFFGVKTKKSQSRLFFSH